MINTIWWLISAQETKKTCKSAKEIIQLHNLEAKTGFENMIKK